MGDGDGGDVDTLPESGTVVGSRRRIAFVAAVVVVGVAAAALVLVIRGDTNGADSGATNTTERATTSTAPAEITPQRAFPLASLRLDEAATFRFHGTAHAPETSLLRPGPWLGADVTVEGEVALPTACTRSRPMRRGGRPRP